MSSSFNLSSCSSALRSKTDWIKFFLIREITLFCVDQFHVHPKKCRPIALQPVEPTPFKSKTQGEYVFVSKFLYSFLWLDTRLKYLHSQSKDFFCLNSWKIFQLEKRIRFPALALLSCLLVCFLMKTEESDSQRHSRLRVPFERFPWKQNWTFIASC